MRILKKRKANTTSNGEEASMIPSANQLQTTEKSDPHRVYLGGFMTLAGGPLAVTAGFDLRPLLASLSHPHRADSRREWNTFSRGWRHETIDRYGDRVDY
ncbi:hypothetical protein TNCV_4637841 [Trichonephila clavipes]|uniref:Uncharacterized protein n=1 Tax=Trichonephila clavipes TaxID=2585209 RepID=A0A8X6WCV4_TRICX|nr:hypothetical protein TNCV_4637841 [Trichonephila clavipes]